VSTHADSSKDEYLELDKKVAAAEYEFLAYLAETDKALDTAATKGKEKAEAAGTDLKRKVDASSRNPD